jgi:hypothetical protein
LRAEFAANIPQMDKSQTAQSMPEVISVLSCNAQDATRIFKRLHNPARGTGKFLVRGTT